MTTQTITRSRTPLTAIAAAVLVGLLAAVTTGGAIYFSLFYPNARISAGIIVFVAAFLAVKATEVAAAAGVLRGSRLAWRLLVGLMVVWEVGFSIVKLVVWHETEALLFAVVALLVVTPLLLAPATPPRRRHPIGNRRDLGVVVALMRIRIRFAPTTTPRSRGDGDVRSAAGRREELQRDVVRVLERQAGPVGRVDDLSVLDAQLVQPSLPLLEVGAGRDAERDVVQAAPVRVERAGVAQPIGEDMQPQQAVADGEDDMAERAGVLVEDRLGADQPRVPGHADGRVGNRDGDVGEAGECGHGVSLPLEYSDVQHLNVYARARRPRIGNRHLGCWTHLPTFR